MRPKIEIMCPCPDCLRCCCEFLSWAVGEELDEYECVNDEDGTCKCEREE